MDFFSFDIAELMFEQNKQAPVFKTSGPVIIDQGVSSTTSSSLADSRKSCLVTFINISVLLAT